LNDLIVNAQDVRREYIDVPDTVTQDCFSYCITFLAVPAGGQSTGALVIQADADFLIHNQVQYSGGSTDGTRAIPQAMVMLTDTGTGRQLYSEPVPIDSQFGSGQLPYILPLPKYMFANSNLSVQVTNFSPAQIDRLSLVFNGVKVYKKS